MGQTHLIIKATRLCNLRCAYCHDWRAGPDRTMSFPVLARMIVSALRDPGADAVDFNWHGGETTLVPIAFYEKALLIQSRFRRPGQAVRNYIQTNGTRLTPAWVRFLRSNNFGVGISLDGPPEIHDRYRRDAAGRPSFAEVLEGIRLLREQRLPFSVLMVIDDLTLELGADRVFDFFLEQGIKEFAVLAARPENLPDAPPRSPAEHYADPARMNSFLAHLYDRWSEHGDTSIRIRELEGVRNRVLGLTPGVCTLAGSCFGHFYAIEPNGDVAHCGRFVGDSRYTLGNLMKQDLASLHDARSVRDLARENGSRLVANQSCPEFAVCQGWCPHDSYISTRHNIAHQVDCCGLRPLIEHIRGRLGTEAAVL